MSRYGYTRKAVIILCQIMLCILLLVGCGSLGVDSDRGSAPETTDAEVSGGSAESAAESSSVDGTDSTADHDSEDNRTAEEILAEMMEDKGFWRRVQYSAGIKEEDTQEIIEQKLEQCEELVLKVEEIHSLEELRFLPNLKSLTIDYSTYKSRIEDFTPIAELSGLEQLYIRYTAEQELDLSFLAQMDTVTELFLVDCDLKDASFLEDMPQLRCLSLYQTPVDDLAVLENLTELVELALYGNREAEHIESVGKLLKMQDLGLQDCGISDIGFLSGLTDLRGVNLNKNSVTDLTPLAGLTTLERLGLAENGISDLSPIAGLEKLYDLALDGNQISDISALKNLTHLNQAGLSNNRIEDFSPLADKPELLYVAAYGNPCTDLGAVLQAPMLRFGGGDASEEQLKIVRDWVEKQRPDVEESECIEYSEADLNGDGLPDAAFVVNGEFNDGDDIYASNNSRHMFILLRQEDGSWKELESDIRISDPESGGMRGDPYRGMWMGEGYVLIQHEWGSSTGITRTEIYRYQQGSLERIQTISVGDSCWAYGYDVTVDNETDGTWSRYAIAMDGYRMVRVDLASDEYPIHRAFPRLNLYYASYYTYPDGLPVNMDAVAALEYFRQYVQAEVVQEPLPYAVWQKKGYELLKGVELPDYYYVVQKAGEEETDARKDYIYYLDLEMDNGVFYHVIHYERYGRSQDYRINDSTGELLGADG